jgi:FkbM family methyltransferase
MEIATPPTANSAFLKIIRLSPVFQPEIMMILNRLRRRLTGPKTVKTAFGAIMCCSPRDLIQRQIIDFGFWEPNQTVWIAETLGEGDVFVDIGANVGYYSLLAARAVGETGAVVAVEASRSTFETMERNIALNSFKNIRMVNKAASDAPGVLKLYGLHASNTGRTTTLGDRGLPESGEVEAAPIDQILTADEIGRVKLIKLDIEGAEPPILLRILNTLDLYPADMKIITEVTRDDRTWDAVFALMKAHDFATYYIENFYTTRWYLNWRRFKPPARIDDSTHTQFDVIFSRQSLD